jgi:hypothetical protein
MGIEPIGSMDRVPAPFADAKLLVAVSRAAGRDATGAKQRGFRPSLPNHRLEKLD